MATEKNFPGKLPRSLRNALSSPPIVFFLGLCAGISLMTVVFSFSFKDSVSADFYTCTYGAQDFQFERLKGLICWEGNVTGDPCPFDLETTYSGTFIVSKAEIDAVNKANSRNPDGSKGAWNASFLQ